ncbi:hypothetical protein PVAP13_9KG407570 [Panicum virgatum]|uniref:Uncharacterized protein n=1 Tax=Panicum virgatum TaxID=38727 RepID=A0A8T0N5P8_PANVG|nr:hypothetical protein PVAP13_9KG407570 [Panicum virgatum]
MHLVIPLQRYKKELQRKGPVHPLARKFLKSSLLVKKLQMAVVAVTVVQPPLIRTESNAWDLESASTSACKLCSMVS